MATKHELQLDQFRTVLGEKLKVTELVEDLGATDLIPLLVKCGGLEKMEGDKLKTELRGKLGRERNPVVIDCIRKKDSLKSYLALSQVVQFKNEYAWSKIFSFAKGTHGKLTVKSVASLSKPIQPAAEQPTIMWLCTDQRIFDIATDMYANLGTPLNSIMSGTIKYHELASMNDYEVNVWLCLSKSIQSIDMHKFYQTYDKTKYCIFTGHCAAVNHPTCQFGDICVSVNDRPSFPATLEHKTREWENNNEVGSWFCLKKRDAGSQIVFGRVGESETDNTADFVSEEGWRFSEKSKAANRNGTSMQYTTVLMATQDNKGCSEEWCDCGDRNSNHLVRYSHKLIQDLVHRVMLQKCRSGRNPSI